MKVRLLLYIPVSIISSTVSSDTVHIKEGMCLSGAPEYKKMCKYIIRMANVYVNK